MDRKMSVQKSGRICLEKTRFIHILFLCRYLHPHWLPFSASGQHEVLKGAGPTWLHHPSKSSGSPGLLLCPASCGQKCPSAETRTRTVSWKCKDPCPSLALNCVDAGPTHPIKILLLEMGHAKIIFASVFLPWLLERVASDVSFLSGRTLPITKAD